MKVMNIIDTGNFNFDTIIIKAQHIKASGTGNVFNIGRKSVFASSKITKYNTASAELALPRWYFKKLFPKYQLKM